MARRALEEKAEQLALTSKYKSEFLANMSHELRTPLNSLLILSKLLADNPQGNLNDKQVEFARTINSAGSDLLNLINDILDLSKIESGTVSIEVGDMPLQHLKQHMERTFRQLAADKGLDFNVEFDGKLPRDHPHRREAAAADRAQPAVQRLQVHLEGQRHARRALRRRAAGARATRCCSKAERAIEIAVTDTGIGIPEDKQKLIFEAFQQADGTTSRKYGGTGLGLSISREIARLLGGELQVRSKPGEGSTFTLFVPLEAEVAAGAAPAERPARYDNSGAVVPTALPTGFEVNDDRDELGKDPFVLIVEDDPTFAAILLDAAHEAGLKGVVSTAGAGTLAMARKLQPTRDHARPRPCRHRRLRAARPAEARPARRSHVPIHVISGADRSTSVIGMGAFGVTEKPAERADLVRVFTELRRSTRRRASRKRKAEGRAGALDASRCRSSPAPRC